jgi:hypothetical protein
MTRTFGAATVGGICLIVLGCESGPARSNGAPSAGPSAITAAPQVESSTTTAPHAHHVGAAVGIGSVMEPAELARLRQATATYREFQAAYDVGYSVKVPVGGLEYVPQMGIHYLNQGIPATFDRDHPQILLYEPAPNGRLQLVAVEFISPIPDLNNPPPPPEGFTGSRDAWAINQEYSLWTLHVWVWKENPDGIFAPFNPKVP